MSASRRKIRLASSAVFFCGMAAVWAIGAPLAWAQTCPTCPTDPVECNRGPNQLCHTVTTCSGNTCTTDFYYYT